MDNRESINAYQAGSSPNRGTLLENRLIKKPTGAPLESLLLEKFGLLFVAILRTCPISNYLFHCPACADTIRMFFQNSLVGTTIDKRIGLLAEGPDRPGCIFSAVRSGERPVTFQLFPAQRKA